MPLQRTITALFVGLLTLPAAAQDVPGTAVYVNDSPIASSTLLGLDDLLGRGNLTEAARTLQRLLDEHGSNVIESGDDSEHWVSVRSRVHAELLARPDLLSLYSEIENEDARRMVESGAWKAAAATRFLTRWGFEAGLRVAQSHLEAGHFQAARVATLELRDHPTRRGRAGATEASRMLSLVARYVDDDATWALASQWAQDAGEPDQQPTPIVPPPWTTTDVLSPLEAIANNADLAGVVETPFAEAALPAAGDETGGLGRVQRPGTRAPRSGESTGSWAVPAIVGDLLIVNDGLAVAAWDRYTLQPRWAYDAGDIRDPARTRAAVQSMLGRGSGSNGGTTVTVDGTTVIAPIGLPALRSRNGDSRLCALTLATGELLWTIDPSEVDPALEDAVLHGHAVVSDGVVVVKMRRAARAQRLAGASLVGIDLASGSMLWRTPLGTIGALPYQSDASLGHTLTAADGIVYALDEVGIAAAIEGATGNIIWLRRFDAPEQGNVITRNGPWTDTAPIVDGDRIITLSPDRSDLLALDRATGAVLARRASSDLGGPLYIARSRDHIAAITMTSAYIIPIDNITAPARMYRINTDGVRIEGLAWGMGDTFAIPTNQGITLIDPAVPSDPRRIPLDRTGHAIATDGYIALTDGGTLRTYLNWDTAVSILGDRLKSNPADAEAAVTLAELAYRGNRPQRILPAVDAALDAITAARAGVGGETEAVRLAARLFDAAQAMIEQSLAGDADALSGQTLTDLHDRAKALATTPPQQLAHALLEGGLAERRADNAAAVDAYQRILTTPRLAAATWVTPLRSLRGEIEAARRLETRITADGPAIYARYDAEAVTALAAESTASGTPEDAENVASRYPLALAAPAAHLLAATRATDTRAVQASLRRALATARRLARIGRTQDPAVIGRIAGRLIAALRSDGRVDEAREIALAARDLGVIELDVNGETADLAAVINDLSKDAASRRLEPVIGRAVDTDAAPQLLSGYILRPLASATPGAGDLGVAWADGALMVSPRSGTLRWIEPNQDEGEPTRERWSRDIESEPVLLRRDGGTAWLYTITDSARYIERVALTDGTVAWRSRPLDDLFNQTGGPAVTLRRLRLPNGSNVDSTQAVIAIDGRSIALADRGGRVLLLDAATGEPLWTARTSLTQVHDIDIRDGILAIAGLSPRDEDPGSPWTGDVLVYNAPDGDPLASFRPAGGSPDWVRVGPDGDVIVASDGAISMVRLPAAEAVWEIDRALTGSARTGLVIGPRLLLLDGVDKGTFVDIRSGTLESERLIPQRAPDALSAFVHAAPIGDTGVLVSTEAGILRLGTDAATVWRDGLDTRGRLTPAAVAGNTVVVAESIRERPTRAGLRHRVHLLDADTGMIIQSVVLPLFAEIQSMAVMDGCILIEAGDATVALRATDRAESP